MNVGGWLLWGFVGTTVLTMVMSGSQSFGLTRMNVPYLLGTIFITDRDKAEVVGISLHLINGWLFSLIYVAAFHATGVATWWFGAAIGAVHAGFVLSAGMASLPGLHPRMAGENAGPTVVAQLEPPGFLALHYGRATPVSVILAHLAFGAILGVFYGI